MLKSGDWEPYNPTWLVELAREQRPEAAWLPGALAVCTRCLRESDAYLFFVDPHHENESGAAWQFHSNLDFQSPTEGLIVLDILTNHRVGGVEFLHKIFV